MTTRAHPGQRRPADVEPASRTPGPEVGTHLRWLSAALGSLAACLALIAVLGPLITGAVRYRYSVTMLNQATGLDAFALAVVAPLAVLAAVLVARRHPAGPLFALAPAGFAAYMLPQYVVGPEYLTLDGNGERAFLLFLGTFVLSGAVLFGAWSVACPPAWPERLWGRRAGLLLALAVFVVMGMYVGNGFFGALWDFPDFVADRAATSEYDEHPTAYWLVAFLDLAVVVPLTVATAVGLLRRRRWAARASYAVLGWYAAVPGSVAAMALTMLYRDDPAADTGRAVVITIAAVLFLALATRAFVPLLQSKTWSLREHSGPVTAAARSRGAS